MKEWIAHWGAYLLLIAVVGYSIEDSIKNPDMSEIVTEYSDGTEDRGLIRKDQLENGSVMETVDRVEKLKLGK